MRPRWLEEKFCGACRRAGRPGFDGVPAESGAAAKLLLPASLHGAARIR